VTGERLFVAVEVPRAVRERVGAACARVRQLAPEAKWVEEAAMHVTLVFLGNTDGERKAAYTGALARSAAKHGPFTLRFGSAGTLGGRHARVLWAGVTGNVAALSALHGDAVAELRLLGFAPEERAFTPHLTLARARRPRGDPLLWGCAEALAGDDFGETRVSELVLFKSELGPRGPIHTLAAALPLGA
jgi:2'-5' RNA ligase